MAVPMKRQMINVEQLRFPSGIAAAETLKALHSHGAKGVRAAKALSWAGIISAIDRFVVEGLHLISPKLASLEVGNWLPSWNKSVLGPAWVGRTVSFSWDFILVAAGMLTGMHVGWSMLLGGTLCWAVLCADSSGAGHPQYRGRVQGFHCLDACGGRGLHGDERIAHVSLCNGAPPCAPSLVWARCFPSARPPQTRWRAIETPGSWFLGGQVVSLIALSWLASQRLLACRFGRAPSPW
jgi:hypothetical protein